MKKNILPGKFLKPLYFVLNDGSVFIDKYLPSDFKFRENQQFDSSYFLSLHRAVSSLKTFNFNGARIRLKHNKINVDKFRDLLPSYFSDIGVLQYLEFGFLLGLVEDHILKPSLRNHSSSYDFFSHIDRFINNELEHRGMTGPFDSFPFVSFTI